MKRGLLLVDIQNDYFPGGRMQLVGMEQAAQNAAVLLNKFRSEEAPVVHIRHVAMRPGATFFLPDTQGAEIHPAVAPGPDETVLVKHYPNSFRETALHTVLERLGVGEVVICGAMSHMCIDATTRAAFDHGFRCQVVEDACATRNLAHNGLVVEAHQVHAAFMAALAAVYAKVVTAKDFAATADSSC